MCAVVRVHIKQTKTVAKRRDIEEKIGDCIQNEKQAKRKIEDDVAEATAAAPTISAENQNENAKGLPKIEGVWASTDNRHI